MKKIALLYYLVLQISLLCGQDQQYSQLLKTQGMLNPAYNGLRDVTSGLMLYRNQWAGISGAPVSEAFNIHAPVGIFYGLGAGVVVMHDKISLYSKFNAALAISYHINLNNETSRLSFGLQGGINSYKLDLTKVVSDKGFADPDFSSQESWVKPNFGAGAFYYSNKIFAGISVPSMFNYSSGSSSYSINNFQIYYYGGYLYDVVQDIKLKPAMLIKQMTGSPLQFDLSLNVYYKDIIGIDLGWRRNDAVIFGIDYRITSYLGISYTYDYTTSALNEISKGSHEISIYFEIANSPNVVKSKNIDNIKIPNIRYF